MSAIVSIVGFFSFSKAVVAQSVINLQVPLPQPGGEALTQASEFGTYVSALYVFGTGFIISFAIIKIMWAGIQWTTAGDNAGKIDEARKDILTYLFGLALAIFAYSLLYTINPNLTKINLNIIEPIKLKEPPIIAPCVIQDGQFIGKACECGDPVRVAEEPSMLNLVVCCRMDTVTRGPSGSNKLKYVAPKTQCSAGSVGGYCDNKITCGDYKTQIECEQNNCKDQPNTFFKNGCEWSRGYCESK